MLFVDCWLVCALCLVDGVLCDVWLGTCCMCGDCMRIEFVDCVCVVYVVVEMVSMGCHVVVCVCFECVRCMYCGCLMVFCGSGM